MFESHINAIFPTPVYQSKLNRNFTGKELLFVNNNKNIVYNNTGNKLKDDMNYLIKLINFVLPMNISVEDDEDDDIL
jgi:hypothetical protein